MEDVEATFGMQEWFVEFAIKNKPVPLEVRKVFSATSIHNTLLGHVVTCYKIQRWLNVDILILVYQLLLPVRRHTVQVHVQVGHRIECLGISQNGPVQLSVSVQRHNLGINNYNLKHTIVVLASA